MEYRSQLSSMYYFFAFFLLTSISDVFDTSLILLFGIGAFLISSVNFKFQIINDCLWYELLIWKFSLHKKVVTDEKIKKISFKRSGWKRKSAVIHLKKGLNIRLSDFRPNTYCEQLKVFAAVYGIPVTKSRDYLLLEKYYS